MFLISDLRYNVYHIKRWVICKYTLIFYEWCKDYVSCQIVLNKANVCRVGNF